MEAHIALRFSAPGLGRELLEGFFLLRHPTTASQEHEDGSLTFFIPKSEWEDDEAGPALDRFLKEHTEIRSMGAEEIAARDWNAEWEAAILPQWATKELLIAPSWRQEEARSMHAAHMLVIDPKMSFGTGHHETTRLCLHAIERLDIRDKTVLDLGTGTGVLALYALVRGVRSAVGVDTDEWSIANAPESRERNGISETVFDIRRGTLEEVVTKNERFDLVLANIHRNVLLELAGPLREHASKDAMLILSGILIYDAPEVRTAFEKNGWSFCEESIENEWACLIFKAV